jgi:Xaa-Pro dipeptidase
MYIMTPLRRASPESARYNRRLPLRNTTMSTSYADHLAIIQQRWDAALEAQSLDAALIAAGQAHGYFLDDQHAPFRANPHLRQWVPFGDVEHCLLLVRRGVSPRLYFHQPRDFWHLPPSVPEPVQASLDVEVFAEREAMERRAWSDLEQHNRTAYVGEPAPPHDSRTTVNPATLLDHLHWHRALKTPFEVQCLTEATAKAVHGHIAAARTFAAGGSEFDIHIAYLGASRQNERDLPYSNIVGINTHAGTLHYQHYDRERPAVTRSLLIDAGASAHGYAADITRTYSAAELAGTVSDEPSRIFSEMIERLDQAQHRLVAEIKPGLYFPSLQESAHRAIGELLAQLDIVSCSGEEAFDNKITDAFFPHGLGHLLGLQTHDVGGHLNSPAGGTRTPDPRYPSLRLTRPLEEHMVITVEPGIYFIPMLLEPLRNEPRGGSINWRLVDALHPFGGIRIEDNVLVHGNGTVNFTRRAFAGADGAGDAVTR